MAFPIFHGITLAENSYIENLNVESLAADPVPVGPGRIWFNNVEKVFKYSSLDGGGAVVVRTFGSLTEIQSLIAAEATAREAADLVLQGNIDAEATARAAADLALQGAIDAEATARAAADLVLQGNIDNLESLVTALGNAFNYVGGLNGGADSGSALDLETLPAGGRDAGDYYKVLAAGYFKVGAAGTPFYANVGDGIVWNTAGGVDKIDNTDSNVQGTAGEIAVTGSADTGFIVGLDAAFSARVAAAEGSVSTLISDLAAETTAREAADLVLQGNIDAEATARAAADQALQGAIDAETTARTAADQALQGAIDAEATARAAADSTLDGKIGNLATLTTTEKGSLVGAVNEVVALVGGGTDAVRDDYNATIFTYQAPTGATVHTITHNLNASFVDVGVQVERADGKYYNDIVSVEEVDSNNVKVYLSTAQKVKVICRSAVAL